MTYTVWLRHQDGMMSRSDQDGPLDEAIEAAYELAEALHLSGRIPAPASFEYAREHRT